MFVRSALSVCLLLAAPASAGVANTNESIPKHPPVATDHHGAHHAEPRDARPRRPWNARRGRMHARPSDENLRRAMRMHQLLGEHPGLARRLAEMARQRRGDASGRRVDRPFAAGRRAGPPPLALRHSPRPRFADRDRRAKAPTRWQKHARPGRDHSACPLCGRRAGPRTRRGPGTDHPDHDRMRQRLDRLRGRLGAQEQHHDKSRRAAPQRDRMTPRHQHTPHHQRDAQPHDRRGGESDHSPDSTACDASPHADHRPPEAE